MGDSSVRIRRGVRGVGPVILVAEAHLSVIEVEEPLVGDGDPVGVAADVVEHLVGAGEGWLRVDHPLRLPRRVQMRGHNGHVYPFVVSHAGSVHEAMLEVIATFRAGRAPKVTK